MRVPWRSTKSGVAVVAGGWDGGRSVGMSRGVAVGSRDRQWQRGTWALSDQIAGWARYAVQCTLYACPGGESAWSPCARFSVETQRHACTKTIARGPVGGAICFDAGPPLRQHVVRT